MSGYHCQHWYSYYSCGLTGDTGCCTLCALTYHRSHEVCYSRLSSFFCDCGAGNATASEKPISIQCKCLQPLSDEDVDKAYDGDHVRCRSDDSESERDKRDRHQLPLDTFALDIACEAFNDEATSAVEDLLSIANGECWIQHVLSAMSDYFRKCSPEFHYGTLANDFGQLKGEDSCLQDWGLLKESLVLRRGKPLDLQPLEQDALCRSGQSGQPRFS